MNPIDIIKENLEAMATMPEYDQDDAHRLRNMAKNTLTALDGLTVKVSDEEIERIAEAVIPPFTGMATAHSLRIEHQHEGALKALRHARDKWLAPSQWIKTSERLPEMPDEMYGAMVSKRVLAHLGHDDYEVMQCQQEIGTDNVQWFNGVDVVDAPRSWTPIPNPTK